MIDDIDKTIVENFIETGIRFLQQVDTDVMAERLSDYFRMGEGREAGEIAKELLFKKLAPELNLTETLIKKYMRAITVLGMVFATGEKTSKYIIEATAVLAIQIMEGRRKK